MKKATLFAGLYAISSTIFAISTGHILMSLALAFASAGAKTVWSIIALRLTGELPRWRFPVLFAGMVCVTALLMWAETGQVLAGLSLGLLTASIQSAYSSVHHWWADRKHVQVETN